MGSLIVLQKLLKNFNVTIIQTFLILALFGALPVTFVLDLNHLLDHLAYCKNIAMNYPMVKKKFCYILKAIH